MRIAKAPPTALLAALAGAPALLAGCSSNKHHASAPSASPLPGDQASASPRAAPSKPTRGSPLYAFSLAESLEQAGGRPNGALRDSIVGSASSAPSSATPTAPAAPDAALDTLESLAQISFAAEGCDFDPAVSRDGKFIVYASTQHRPTADIYLKSVTGRSVTQLTADPAQDVMPAISPDGSRIAFASNRTGSWDIYVMSASGGQAVQVSSDPAHELHPSWSPDGKRLVYCRLGETSARWEMWVADVEQPMAGEFIGYGLFPSWCPVAATGQGGRDRILFQRSRERGDRAFSIWTVEYKPGDASSPTEVVSSPDAAVINPAWSPDGLWIAYATVPFNQPGTSRAAPAGAPDVFRPASADLWMSGVDGSSRVNLTSGSSVNLLPAWGPGARVYFVSDRGGSENIWSMGTEKAMAAATGRGPGTGSAATASRGSAAPAGSAEQPQVQVPEAGEPGGRN